MLMCVVTMATRPRLILREQPEGLFILVYQFMLIFLHYVNVSLSTRGGH